FVEHLGRDSFGAWDEFVMPALAGDARTTDILSEALRTGGLEPRLVATTNAPYLALPASWEEYLRSLNKKKRKGLVSAQRDFEAWAGLDCTIERARTPDQLKRGMAILKDLHGRRWQSAGADHSGAFV